MNSNELYAKLETVRDKLKEKFYSNGRTPTICTDEALQELARLAPRHKEDMLCVNGLGKTFVDKYGDYFMQVLSEYHRSNVSVKQLKAEVKDTLKNLENRLVNISKRNRLLYMGKIYSKFAFDLFSDIPSFNQSVVNLLMGKQSKLKLCNINYDESANEKRFKTVVGLLREISKDFRESGQYDLYIGYPYVVGKTLGEDFNVRAPLALFPITFEKTVNDVVISLDKSKDILYNTNLILMQNKFLNKSDELPNNAVEDIDAYNFADSLKMFYKKYDIDITVNEDIRNIKKFRDLKQNEFPNFKNGEFYVRSYAVLGKFSLYSSALQKDFKSMTEDTEINDLLDDLLADINSIDFRLDKLYDEDIAPQSISEKNLNYINNLNASQEQAILWVDGSKKMVIQGPPGTGKSQTITSLIADNVIKGKNVVVVSQKKAALDVINSRLGNLSKYAIMLNDVKDKEGFYRQLKELFSAEKYSNFDKEQFNSLASNIDSKVKSLEIIADKLYNTKTNGTYMYKIYQDNLNNIFKTKKDFENLFYKFIDEKIINLDYLELKSIKEKFSNSIIFDNTLEFIKLDTLYPYLGTIKETFKNLEIKKMQSAFEEYSNEQTEYLKQNFLKRLFGKGKRKKITKQLFSKYFNSKTYRKFIFNNPEVLTIGAKSYLSYLTNKEEFNRLTENEKNYAKIIYKVKSLNNEAGTNDNLFDFIIYCIIDDFETANGFAFNSIRGFEHLVFEISSLISEKREITKERLKDTIIKAYNLNINESKRYSELLRQIESNRKINVTRLVKKFSFELFKGIKIWLMTPESVSEVLPLEKGLFDLLIFDEASQIYIERGIPAISRAKKVVIAGDYKQLRPSSLGIGRIEYNDSETLDDDEIEDTAALEEESLLDLARFKYPSVLLNYHYRSKYEELINFSNYAFYDGKLNVSPNIFEPEKPPIEVVKIDNGLWTNRCNKNEAIKVVEIIKDFLFNRKNNETLGVITFNVNQRDAILDELDKACLEDKKFNSLCKKEFDRKDNGEDFGLFVKNIENVQGDERDCIIFSTGYAKNESGKIFRNFGWLNQLGGENRLNVAISRAKQKIYMVTSIYPEELTIDDLKNDGPKLFRKYLEYCYAISDKNYATANNILYSFAEDKKPNYSDASVEESFANSVYDELKSLGLNVYKQVGVGGYKIDIAIKDTNDKKYLFGLECDSKLYSSPMQVKERDIYRQQYLESRGWKIYRIWSSNWWHNKDKEIKKILNVFKELK